jgi:GT2 family glycosyltransferase
LNGCSIGLISRVGLLRNVPGHSGGDICTLGLLDRVAETMIIADESFRWAEDTELFCRLNRQGFDLLKVNAAPVIHLRRPSAKRVRRAFRYGLYWAKLNHRYGHYGDPMRLTGVVQYCCRMLAEASLNLLGLALGNLIY